MADEPTPTPSSDPKTDPTPNPAPSDPPADPAKTPPADPAPKQDGPPAAAKDDALEPTALGGGDPEPKDGDAPKGEVPETYELTPPEGFDKLDPEAIAAATPVFKELGLTNEQAQSLMPVAGEFAKRIVEERDQALIGTIMDQRKGWLETAKNDPEMGGANWDATLASAAKALDQLGFPKGSPLRAFLDESGTGNHPELIRLMAKVGKAIGEDTDFPRGDQGGKVARTAAEQLYGPAFAPKG